MGTSRLATRTGSGSWSGALDYGELVCEDDKARTLAEVLGSGKGPAEWFAKEGVDL
jgi:hypothetical protein